MEASSPCLKRFGPNVDPHNLGQNPKLSPLKRYVFLSAICTMIVVGACLSGLVWAQDRDSVDEARETTIQTQLEEEITRSGECEAIDFRRRLAHKQIFSNYSNSAPQKKNLLRAGLETMVLVGSAEAYYLGTLSKPDSFEYETYEDSLRARFITGNAYRLDINSWGTNIGHIADGAVFYLLPRTNGMSLTESFLFATAVSTGWETFGEFRDEFSINDAVMTPFGGFATGEVVYQLGEFFQHSSQTIPNRILGYLFGPTAALHRILDKSRPDAPASVDRFGFTTDVWHQFRLSAGGGVSTPGDSGAQRAETSFGFDLELVTAEKYRKPGEACIFYLEGVFNDLSFNAAVADGEFVDARLIAKTSFLGHYRQNIVTDRTRQTLEGYSLFMGLSSAFEYYSHDFSGTNREDTLAICDLIGPSLIADFYRNGIHIRTSVDAFPTFSMVHPSAGDVFDRTHILGRGEPQPKFLYSLYKYYYALGLSASGKFELDYGPFGIEMLARYHWFDSIEGLNLIHPDLDSVLYDDRLSLQGVFYFKLPFDNFKLALDVERLYRWSKIADFSMNMHETRYLGKIVYEF